MIILITGATSGIGRAAAEIFAGQKHDLILTGRREDRLSDFTNQLKNKFQIEILPLCFDIRNREAVKTAIEQLPERWKSIDVLLNNAGLAAGLDFIQEGSIDDWDQMIDTNLKGLLYITRAVSPGMAARKKGHIINIGSIAGKLVYPKGNVYCATKFAVDALTQGMRIDLLEHGIKVSQVCPGAVETEFSDVRFKGDKALADTVYSGYQPLSAYDIANAVSWIVNLPQHVNINDLTIMPVAQAAPAYHYKK